MSGADAPRDPVIAELYAAFAGRRFLPEGPHVCTYCCTTLEVVARVAKTAPEDVSLEDLRECLCAAQTDDMEQRNRDRAVVIPRCFDLLAQGIDPKGIGPFAIFSYTDVWPILNPREQTALVAALDLVARRSLTRDPSCAQPEFRFYELFEMVMNGGLPDAAVVEAIATSPSAPSAVDAISDLLLNRQELWKNPVVHDLRCASLERRVETAKRLKSALFSVHVRSLLEVAVLSNWPEPIPLQASLAYEVPAD